MRYISCSREFSVLETEDFTAKETAINKKDEWWKENIIVSGLEVGSELQGDQKFRLTKLLNACNVCLDQAHKGNDDIFKSCWPWMAS